MKKKVKLITTIASLGLALALMAFGVYAATSATFSITSSVAFTAANDIYLSINRTSSKVQEAPQLAADLATAAWVDSTVAAPGEWATYTGTGDNLSPKATATDGAWAIGDLEFKNTDGSNAAVYSYKYIVVFNVDKAMPANASAVNMTITDNTVTDTNVQVGTKYNIGAGLTDYTAAVDVKSVAKGATITVEFTLSLKDPAVSVEKANATFNPVITFTAVGA